MITCEVDSPEFVGEDRFVTVTERVEVVDPEQPSLHRLHRDHVASVGHHERDQDTGQTGGYVVVARADTESSEEARHDHIGGKDEEVEAEVRSGRGVKTAHEVENDGEDKDVGRAVRDIGEDGRNSIGTRSEEAVTSLSIQNALAHHLTGQFGEGRQGVCRMSCSSL